MKCPYCENDNLFQVKVVRNVISIKDPRLRNTVDGAIKTYYICAACEKSFFKSEYARNKAINLIAEVMLVVRSTPVVSDTTKEK